MIRIITDSTADLPGNKAEELGIEIISLPVYFGQECFRDGVDLSSVQFYEKLFTVEELPKTSQITPVEFLNIFKNYLEMGDEVFGIFLSSELSGTYQSAALAKAEINSEKIVVLDSRTVTLGLGILAIEAAKLRNAGKSLEEIASTIKEYIPRLRLWAVVDTLKYLKMGGRISAASAVMGSVIGISPLISVKDGKVEAIGKSRGRKNGLKRIAQLIEREKPDTNHTIIFGHSNAQDALAEELKVLLPLIKVNDYLVCNIGAAVGTHAGPGAVGIAYIAE